MRDAAHPAFLAIWQKPDGGVATADECVRTPILRSMPFKKRTEAFTCLRKS